MTSGQRDLEPEPDTAEGRQHILLITQSRTSSVESNLRRLLQVPLLTPAFCLIPIWNQQWAAVTLAKCSGTGSWKQFPHPGDMSPAQCFPRLRNHHLTSEWFTRVLKSLAGKTMLPMWILFFHQNWEICYYPLKFIFNVYLFWLFAFWTLIWSFIAPPYPLHISLWQCFTEFDSTWLCFLHQVMSHFDSPPRGVGVTRGT